jgi:hypothetical protein
VVQSMTVTAHIIANILNIANIYQINQ